MLQQVQAQAQAQMQAQAHAQAAHAQAQAQAQAQVSQVLAQEKQKQLQQQQRQEQQAQQRKRQVELQNRTVDLSKNARPTPSKAANGAEVGKVLHLSSSSLSSSSSCFGSRSNILSASISAVAEEAFLVYA
jgi:hypothetical protein